MINESFGVRCPSAFIFEWLFYRQPTLRRLPLTRPSSWSAPALGRVYYCNKTYDPLPHFLSSGRLKVKFEGGSRDGRGRSDPYIVTFGLDPESELKGDGLMGGTGERREGDRTPGRRPRPSAAHEIRRLLRLKIQPYQQ